MHRLHPRAITFVVAFFVLFLCILSSTVTPLHAQSTPALSGDVSGNLQDELPLIIGEKESRYTRQEGLNPLEIRFCDQKTTKEYCVTPTRMLNRAGSSPTSGIKIEPAVEGEWRWQTDYILTFTPKKIWPTEQAYTVQFDPTLFPAFVKLNTTQWGFVSEPLRGTISGMTFFQDPNDVKKKLVSTIVNFNAPVISETADKQIRFQLEEGTDKAITIKDPALAFKTEWSGDKTQVSITTPIAKLAENETFVKVNLGGDISPVHGGGKIKLSEGKISERVLIPSLYSYVQIQSATATVVKNAKFEPQQVVAIQLNTPVSIEELQRSLSLKLLPKDKAAPVSGQSPKKDYSWTSPTEVMPELLVDAPVVPFTINPIATSESTSHTLTFSAEPNRWVYLEIKKGMKTYGDFILGKDFVNTLQVPAFAKEVKILPAEGSILSLSGDKKITLMSLGVDTLRVEMGRVLPESINHMVSQSYGSFSNPQMNSEFSLDSITEVITKDISLSKTTASKPSFSAFDFGEYVGSRPTNKGMFFFKVSAITKNEKGVESVTAEDARFILVTDLGFLVKKNRDASREVFVQSLEDGESVYGASVEVIGRNGLPVATATTDWNGHATIPDLAGLEREKQPVAFLVKDGRDLSFMPFDRSDRALNYSRFETGGEWSAENGLRAYVFSDRGIYRPGESIHIGMVVKQGDWTKSLEGLPLMLEIMNPRGQYIIQKPVTLNAEGFIEYEFETKDTSPTGNYYVNLSLSEDNKAGAQIGSTSVRVEEFMPDTMKITSKFNKPETKGWITPENLEASINLMNLYGTPAAEHVVKANINLAPGAFAFKDLKDYTFYDAKYSGKTFDQALSDGKTDDKGDAVFPLDLKSYGDSTYRLTFYAEGFEEGSGKSVKTAKSILVSSLPYVVGYKADGPLNYINQNSARSVRLLAVDPTLAPADVKDISLETVEVSYIQSLVQSGSGYSYQSVAKEKIASTETVSINPKGLDRTLNTEKPGDYIIRLKNSEGLVISQFNYSVVGDAATFGATQKDNVVEVKLNKETYEPDETVELSLVAPYTGSGLITLETDKVLAIEWFEASTVSSIQHIKIPQDFAGKGFINVQYIRAKDSKEIYTNPLSVGIAPIMVGTDALNSGISLTVPDMVKPGEALPISFFTRKPTKIAIFAVDEGILQYGHYKTPDPLKFLVGNRALQVETYQILDQLLPEYSVLQSMSAFGGDMALGDGKNLNPFKRKGLPPVVYWSGIIDADKNVKEVTYTVPEHFNGSLRVMAVAVSADTVGAIEQKTTVRADLIVSPNAPLFVAPGDEFDVTTSVANNIKGSGDKKQIQVSVAPSSGLEVVGEKEQTLTIAEGKEATVTLRIKAKDVLGNATLKFSAKSGDAAAHMEANMSIRPPVASSTELVSGYFEKGARTIPLGRTLYPEFADASVSVSGLPMSMIPGLAKYLEHYPYGCSEQLLSQTFPNLVLHDDPDFNTTFKGAHDTVAGTFATLMERQSSDGGIGLWWSGDVSDPFVSIYALHYMTVAKERNFPVPITLYNRNLEFVRQLVNRSVVSLEQARQTAYGIYLLTRNGEVTSNYLPYLMQYLEQNQKDVWKNDIIAMYVAATYKLLQLNPEAEALVQSFNLGEPKYWSQVNPHLDVFYNDLIRHSMYLYILSEHFPERLKTLDKKVLFRVANFVGEGSYNTIASSYAILGISAYAKAQSMNLSDVTVTPEGASSPLALSGQKVKSATFDPQVRNLAMNSPSDGVFVQVATTGFERTLSDKPVHNGIEITRQYEDANGNPVAQAKLGEAVYVRLTVRSYNNEEVSNIAVVDLLPGGFDPVPESLRDVASTTVAQEGEEQTPAPSTLDTRNTWIPQAVDIREDRAILMGTFSPEPQVFIYRIKPVNHGRFTTPPPFAESMYQRAIYSKGIAGKLEVTEDAQPVPVTPAAAQ
jgi:uncharacterized protein YfaS (alpha-2-macroglobulin family)